MGFRIGLVGAGRMGRTHLAALTGSAQVSVAGVVEPYPSPALSGVPIFATLAEMLAATEIDAALIAVPTDQHVAVLGQVMAAGLPALCEKPCGLTAAQATNCATIAEEAGLVLQVAYWRRFRASSGGIVADMGVHEFDQIRWLTGQEFASMRSARTGGDDPDCAQIVAELDGGSTAVISLGRWHPAGDSVKVEVYGTTGTVSRHFLPPVGGEAAFHQALRLQAEDFARLVRTGQGSGARPVDAVAALRAAEWSSK